MRGMDIFRNHFCSVNDQFFLIGGAACDIMFEEAGLSFRATRDLDIVLCIEVLDSSFVSVFWEFIHSGKYEIKEKSTGQKQFYRFSKPQNEDYPYMLELFSRLQDGLELPEGTHLTCLSIDQASASLSAILMDSPYYDFLHSGKMIMNGIPIVMAEYLVPLKARAWLDLSDRRNDGERIDSRRIRKHRNDVFRLYRIIQPAFEMTVPDVVRNDMSRFIDSMKEEIIDLNNLEVSGITVNEILEELKGKYVDG